MDIHHKIFDGKNKYSSFTPISSFFNKGMEEPIGICFNNTEKLHFNLYKYILECLEAVGRPGCYLIDICDTISEESVFGAASELQEFADLYLPQKIRRYATTNTNFFNDANLAGFLNLYSKTGRFPFIIYYNKLMTNAVKFQAIKSFLVDCKKENLPIIVTVMR